MNLNHLLVLIHWFSWAVLCYLDRRWWLSYHQSICWWVAGTSGGSVPWNWFRCRGSPSMWSIPTENRPTASPWGDLVNNWDWAWAFLSLPDVHSATKRGTACILRSPGLLWCMCSRRSELTQRRWSYKSLPGNETHYWHLCQWNRPVPRLKDRMKGGASVHMEMLSQLAKR